MMHCATIPVNWVDVVQKIRRGEQAAIEELYSAIVHGARPRLARSLGNDAAQDRVHEILVIVIEAIQRGEPKDPERLMGFVQTVARRLIVANLRSEIRDRRGLAHWGERKAADSGDPERSAAQHELIVRARRAVARLSPIDSEILQRFTFLNSPPSGSAVKCN